MIISETVKRPLQREFDLLEEFEKWASSLPERAEIKVVIPPRTRRHKEKLIETRSASFIFGNVSFSRSARLWSESWLNQYQTAIQKHIATEKLLNHKVDVLKGALETLRGNPLIDLLIANYIGLVLEKVN